ncbi:putative secreted protein (Por secretion system target) [Flavobacterium araucananum]|uniref:Secretion system C-terminal sorting domain-containing protein n=1 Tax=Flavobacterium araucananum TaxID=946678 RepID=A0A227PBV3_9FLAO|nr:T9SS type A sorting domain-containing protein [Flavobacterium araucananum]OXG06545.1 hypothetical protein B0A64_10575 [Flavobacterium araucananum]PWK00890.1 putative secreted protein (Por secretion system target) [Flavobacterium araucananum]
MKKYYLLLLFFISLFGFSQTDPNKADENGAKPVTITTPKAIVVDGVVSKKNPTGFNRNDGSISIFFKGGTGSYTYNWTKAGDPSFTAPSDWTKLGAGSYTITAVDGNSCKSDPYPFTIDQIKELLVTITGNKIACKGDATGTLSVTSTSGGIVTSGYSYEWYKEVNNVYVSTGKIGATAAKTLSEGVYKVYVKDNVALPALPNEAWSDPFRITEPANALNATHSKTDITCNGATDGTITLNITGGTAGYSILWSDSVITTSETGQTTRTGLSKRTYSYTITDANGCKFNSTSSIQIIEPAKLSVTTTSQKQPTSPVINDGQITINASGGKPNYSYVVTKKNGTPTEYTTNIITGLGNGIYDVFVKDANGCVTTSQQFELEALSIKLVKQENIKCFDAKTGAITITAAGGTSPYTYRWFTVKNGVETQIPLQTTSTITDLILGDYRVGLTDAYNKEIYADYYISQPTAPLTATSTFTNVSCNGGNDGTIKLDIKGGTGSYNVVYKDVTDNARIIDPTKLIAGTYSYSIKDDNNCTFNSPANITIIQNTAVTITINKPIQPTIVTANDGQITINANGGTNTYTYILKNNGISTEYPTNTITGLGDGVYEIIAKDSNNCTSTIETVTLKALAVAFVNKVDVTCNGANTGSIEVIASGGTPVMPNQYDYKWYYKQKATDNYTLLTGGITNKIENLYAGFYKVVVTDNVNISRELIIAELTERPAITCTFTQTNVNCFKGSDATITLNIQGGTGDYHVIWNDGSTTKDRTGIPAGDYSFSIKDDNGCSYSVAPIAVKITQPLKPLIIASSTKIEASGYGLKNGSIDVVVSDGTFPYTYQWYEGTGQIVMTGKKNALLNGIGEGTYTVIVTDKNLCTTQDTFTVYQPDELLITSIVETESIKCFGNKQAILKATISGGAPIGVPDANKKYEYKWYNTLTPGIIASTTNPSGTLVAGDYILEVKDGFGNSYTSNPVTVSEPKLLKINYTQKNVSCNGNNDAEITINVTGGTGKYAIVWSTGTNANENTIKNLYASTYNVTVTDDNGCQDFKEIIITEPKVMGIKVEKTAPSALGVDDASIKVTVIGGTPNYNFEWYDKDGKSIYTDNDKESNSIYNIYVGQYFITIIDANGCMIEKRDLDKVDPLFIKLTQINVVKCYGDATASIKAITSGGLPDYYYKWYNVNNPTVIISEAETLLNAKAGTYFVIATDYFGKSITSETITITEPTALDNSLSSQYTRCGDGNDWTITSAATQGTAPYSYLWNTGDRTPNLVNVVPGNYSLLVTDNNGCTITKTITLVAPAHLDAAEVIKIPTCYGGSDATITVTTIAGIAPYTYLWNTGEKSNTLTNAAAGNYTIEITDSKGCIISRTYTIKNPPKDIINIGEDVTLCFDQTLTINATIDDDKATYAWTSDKGFKSNKAMVTVSEPANYTVIVTNKLGCQATDTIKVSSQNTAISAEFAVSSQVFKNEKFIIVDISNPDADEIEWVLPGNATIISKNKDFAEISFSQAGEYDITMNTKKGNCTAYQTKTILVTEGEFEENNPDEVSKKFDLKIYPNPSKGTFTVDVLLDKVMPAHVKVYNLNNNMLIDSKTQDGKDNYLFNFSFNGLPSGVYFVLFESQQGSKLRKIIIQ